MFPGGPLADVDVPRSRGTGDGPLVSVIFATYEPGAYVDDALRSVVEQTYDELELVVVDSSGEPWLERLGDLEWIEYVYQEPQGVSAAWNRGVDVANGDAIGFLADDDYYAPEKVERQVAALEDGADIVYTDEYVIDEDGNTTRLNSLPVEDPETHYIEFFRVGHGVPHLTVVGRTECFEAEPFDEGLDAREDPHLWVRLFRKYTPARVPEALAYKRRRSDSLTSDPDMMYRNEMASVADLVDRFEELEAYRDERERMAKYRYGKQLFHAGRMDEARRVFLEVIREGFLDHRTVALFGTSLLPAGNQAAFELLEKAQERILR